MRSLLIFSFLLASLWATASARGQPHSHELETLLVEALTDYPALDASWAEANALEARQEQVSQPFDPMVSANAMNLPWDSLSLRDHPMTSIQLGARQRFFWPGVLESRRREAEVAVEVARLEGLSLVSRLWLEAIPLYYQLSEEDAVRQVLETRREVLVALEEATQSRFVTGRVVLTAAFRVNTEISRLDQELASLQRRRRTVLAELNGLLNRPVDAPIDPPTLTESEPESSATDRTVEDWVAQIVDRHPSFATLEARRHHLEAGIAAADAGDTPIIEVSAGWSFRFQEEPMDTDLYSLSVGLNVPIFSGRAADARIDELQARQLRLDYDRQDVLRRLRAVVAAHLEAIDGLDEELRILEDEIIPSVQSMYEGVNAHYMASHGSVETLIEMEERLLELDVTRVRLLAAREVRNAMLRALAMDNPELVTIAEERP